MTPITILVAKLLGVLLPLAGIGMLVNGKYCEKALTELTKSAIFARLAAALATLAGTAILIAQNIWSLDANGLVTLLAWGALIKGALLFIVPEQMLAMAAKCKKSLTAGGIVVLVIGGYLAYAGFYGNDLVANFLADEAPAAEEIAQ